MSKLSDLLDLYDLIDAQSTVPKHCKIPDIESARRTLGETMDLRDGWADVCLGFAKQQDWQPVMFKQGQYVEGGQYGWLLFCAMANLSTLRDQVYPALKERLNTQRPPMEK